MRFLYLKIFKYNKRDKNSYIYFIIKINCQMESLRNSHDIKISNSIKNSKLKKLFNISRINTSYSNNKSTKIIKSIPKNSIIISIPIIFKQNNSSKNNMNSLNKTNNNSKAEIKSDYNNMNSKNSKSNKNINRKKILIISNNLKSNNYYNFISGKVSNKLKEIKTNLSNDFKNKQNIIKSYYNKKLVNIEYNNAFRKKKFKIPNNLLLENILSKREEKFDKEYKISGNSIILQRLGVKNKFSREKKRSKKIFHEYNRSVTVSTEKKKNIPMPYSYYLTNTKGIYENMNKTYSFLKDDIIYDLILDKEKNLKINKKYKRFFNNKYDEINKMNDAFTINNLPIVENYIKNKEYKNQENIHNATWSIDGLKNLNDGVAYKHKKFFANKYGIDLRKMIVDIDTNNDDFLIKFQKSLNT
jgi:hypothetical protein